MALDERFIGIANEAKKQAEVRVYNSEKIKRGTFRGSPQKKMKTSNLERFALAGFVVILVGYAVTIGVLHNKSFKSHIEYEQSGIYNIVATESDGEIIEFLKSTAETVRAWDDEEIKETAMSKVLEIEEIIANTEYLMLDNNNSEKIDTLLTRGLFIASELGAKFEVKSQSKNF